MDDDDKFSCIRQVHKTVHISVPSPFISNEVSGITEILDSWKRQYIKQLQGVVVGYKNVSITSRANVFVVDRPAEHYYVTATFYLFCPNIGTIVKGTINRISREHIGCLIHDTINVTIHLSDENYEEISRFINLSNTILFQITHFDFSRKVIRVEGEITPECVRLMDQDEISNSSQKHSLDIQQKMGISSNLDSLPKKKKKKSKHRQVDAFDVLPEIASISDNHFVNFSSITDLEVPFPKSEKLKQSKLSHKASVFCDTSGSSIDHIFPSTDALLQQLKKEIVSGIEVNSESSSQKGETAAFTSGKMKEESSTVLSSSNAWSDNVMTKIELLKKKSKHMKKEKLSDVDVSSETSLKKENCTTASFSKKRKRESSMMLSPSSNILNDNPLDGNEQPPKKKLKHKDKLKSSKKKDKKNCKKDKKKSHKNKLDKEKKKSSNSKSKKLKHKNKKKGHKKSKEKSKGKKKKSSKQQVPNLSLKVDIKSEKS